MRVILSITVLLTFLFLLLLPPISAVSDEDIDGLSDGAGLFPHHNFLWGLDLVFEEIWNGFVSDPINRLDNSLGVMGERQAEFFSCVSRNNIICVNDVVIQSIKDTNVLIKDLEVVKSDFPNHDLGLFNDTINLMIDNNRLVLDSSSDTLLSYSKKNSDLLNIVSEEISR